MAVSFFGGQDGAGARFWSAGKLVANQQDQDELRARIRELESLCTDVLVAGVDIGLPQQLLNQLWAAVGHGELPLREPHHERHETPDGPAPLVVHRLASPEPAPAEGYWYFCPNARAYYPSVQSCSEAWVKVPPRPQ